LRCYRRVGGSGSTFNPAKLLKREKVGATRIRFLDQFKPATTELNYLKPHTNQASRLRAVIEHDFPEQLNEFIIALNTGMRRKEQYIRIDWSAVDLSRQDTVSLIVSICLYYFLCL
jgi:hypothetical protein